MNVAMKSSPPRQRIDVDQYHLMAEEGLLAPDARVELIDGEIIDMAAIGSPHGAVVIRLTRLFQEAVGSRALVSAQGPLRLDRYSEVQPDMQLLAPRSDCYWNSHPAPADVFLIIEVSDSTLRFDTKVKVPLYARHGIPEVWVVDVEGLRVQFFRSLKDGRYDQVHSMTGPRVVSPTALPQVVVDLAELFRH